MELPWSCHGVAMELPWSCYGVAMEVTDKNLALGGLAHLGPTNLKMNQSLLGKTQTLPRSCLRVGLFSNHLSADPSSVERVRTNM